MLFILRMSKDYSLWHQLKARIETRLHLPLFREQEVWWISLGANVGFEQDGKHDLFERPVLIFRKFNRELFWAFPLTTQNKQGKFYFSFSLLGQERVLILSQLRSLSAKRLRRRMSKVSDNVFQDLEMCFAQFLKQTAPRLRGASGA